MQLAAVVRLAAATPTWPLLLPGSGCGAISHPTQLAAVQDQSWSLDIIAITSCLTSPDLDAPWLCFCRAALTPLCCRSPQQAQCSCSACHIPGRPWQRPAKGQGQVLTQVSSPVCCRQAKPTPAHPAPGSSTGSSGLPWRHMVNGFRATAAPGFIGACSTPSYCS